VVKVAAALCELEKLFCELAQLFRDIATPFRQFARRQIWFAESFRHIAQRRGRRVPACAHPAVSENLAHAGQVCCDLRQNSVLAGLVASGGQSLKGNYIR
jgi:hypothetical protein